MMTFATIAAAVGVITVAAAIIDGLGADALTSTTAGPTKTKVTAVTEANPTIDVLVNKVVETSVNPDASEAVAKVDAEIPPAAVVVAKEGVSENPDPTARFGMKHGTDDENSTDWMK